MHADHLMLDRGLASSMGTEIVMHENSPSPLVGRHVRDGDELSLGDTRIQVLHTPGHTPDSVCYVVDGTVFTGDTLLIGGSGRTDFPGGDAGAQFDAIVEKLFVLPDETRVLPAHDYKGQKESSILREKSENPRLAGVSRDQYIDIMANLNLPLPDNVQHSLQVNQSGFEPNEVSFASVAEVATTEEVDAHDLTGFMLRADQLVLIDVREPEEFVGELGHIAGALLIPLDLLALRLPKLAAYSNRPIVCICRAGARSASACAILRRAGFRDVRNLKNGMLGWRAAGLPVEG